MSEPATVSQRLDALPFTRRHTRLLLGSGVGWALDALDVGLVAYVLVALRQQWGLDAAQLSWIASVGFAGMAVGAALGGLLADRVGRRQVFALTLLVYGLATGAAALSWSLTALLVFRFLVGLGLGAELPVASTLVSEFAPRRIRGRVVVALEAFWAVGWTLAALIGYLLVPASDDGWRWALALGALPAVYAIVVRRGLPESVRFLLAKGRTAEAEAVVRDFEASAGVTSTAPLVPDPPAGARRGIWSAGLRRRTAGLWLVWFFVNFSYYGAFTWIPSLLVEDGFTVIRSLQFTLIITLAQLPGYALAAVLVEVWGRRRTLAVFLVGSALSALAYAGAGTTTTILLAGMALSFCNLGAWGALYAVTPEVYPTAVRGRGAGAAAGFGRIASILAPLSVPLLLDAGGSGAVFVVFGVAFAIAAAASFLLPERRGVALD
ncbi:MFS transporter [Kineococcus radiotolerans]|uniref:Major facilitator superfamily MFS_1 n=1 Tax=Kineococcus radiotolerans (strain ATCC BAA-149 / DSM 14245 / SRS30216) TaxID=266940 RepID=A6WF93_KINRD|nr:MFS transporter [Kineococcus radiotolerans]ABS05482.1 major facilitator superfamily MFS_1 [Kineococcus radiotolerans SRS30216 = ATCC BAA-149]